MRQSSACFFLNGVTVNTQTKHSWRGLGSSLYNLVSHDKVAVNIQTEDGRTALFAAAYYGHEAVVNSFSLTKISVNKQTKGGQTPLLAASLNGHEAVVKLLLSHKDILLTNRRRMVRHRSLLLPEWPRGSRQAPSPSKRYLCQQTGERWSDTAHCCFL
jgi:ankyrin repeat protein